MTRLNHHAMDRVIEFPMGRVRPSGEAKATPAEVIIFPGVRIERAPPRTETKRRRKGFVERRVKPDHP